MGCSGECPDGCYGLGYKERVDLRFASVAVSTEFLPLTKRNIKQLSAPVLDTTVNVEDEN
jgi:hypothetical protein